MLASAGAVPARARLWPPLPHHRTGLPAAPAATDTPMLRDPARSAVAAKLPPTGRYIRAEEVAALTAFLLGGCPAGPCGPAGSGHGIATSMPR